MHPLHQVLCFEIESIMTCTVAMPLRRSATTNSTPPYTHIHKTNAKNNAVLDTQGHTRLKAFRAGFTKRAFSLESSNKVYLICLLQGVALKTKVYQILLEFLSPKHIEG
jgi:hypothetical protein